MERHPYAAREVAAVVAAQAALLLALASRYGPHRDELYFVVAGHHLAWGYPDQPAFTPVVAGLMNSIAPSNLVVLRLPSVLAVAGVVLIAVQFARLLGAARAGQVLTAVAVGFSTVVPGLGHLLSTATFDMFFWAAVLVLITQALLDASPRLWLAAGLVAGVGLNNKHTIALCLVAVLIAIALTPDARPVLRTRWPWLGALIAVAMWIPNLVWQAQHGWPVRDLSADIADEFGGLGGRGALLFEAFMMFNPLIGVVFICGVVWLLRRPEWERARVLAWVFVVALTVLLLAGGKGYYLAGAIVPLVAAGCTHLATRWGTGRLTLNAAALVVPVAMPALLPVLPAHVYADSMWEAINDGQLDTIGWPDYAAQVRAVADGLSPEERAQAVIFTDNYGEAGAMRWYDVGLPAYSGHNGYQNWGPPPEGAAPVIVIGDDAAAAFVGCERRARLTDADEVENEEFGAGVWVCDGPRGSWAEAWPSLAHYDA